MTTTAPAATQEMTVPGPTLSQPPTSLGLDVHRTTGSLVGRPVEVAAIGQALGAASGGLSCLVLEGEPGIGKTRLLLVASELAIPNGWTVVAVTADEEIRGPFLVARSILTSPALREDASSDAAEAIRRAADAISGRDEPGLQALTPDRQLLRVFDLGAVALREAASNRPLALLVDDLQWADEDSVRLLRYLVRTAPASPILFVLAMRSDAAAGVGEATTLLADMERLGLVRRLRLARFTQVETRELLRRLLGGDVSPASAATVHAQAEGVPFIVEEVAQSYRGNGMLQRIDDAWTLAPSAERLMPSAVRTLIHRRAARLPAASRTLLGEAAVLGRNFSLRDLQAVKQRLGDAASDMASFAEDLTPAVAAGLLIERPSSAAADYTFAHEQIRDFAASALPGPRRRAIHAALVDLLTADGDPPDAVLPLVARHALAAGDPERTARFSLRAAQAALRARAPEEVLRVVDLALPLASAAQERMPLLLARDEALTMLRRPAERIETLSELGALADALGDPHQQLGVLLRRAAALRSESEFGEAADMARMVRGLAAASLDRAAELAAVLELGQALLHTDIGEGVLGSPAEADLEGAAEAYGRAVELAEEQGDTSGLAAATRELGVVSMGRMLAEYQRMVESGGTDELRARLAAGEQPEAILATTPLFPHVRSATERFESALSLYEGLGDRKGVMSSIIGLAYTSWGAEIRFGAAHRLEDLRRLWTRMRAFTTESERAVADAQMLFGVEVFALAKGAYDLALSRGDDAYRAARALGDRGLEFLAAGFVALAHVRLGEAEEADRWLQRAANAAAASPTPLRARRLETWRGLARSVAGDLAGMRRHLETAVERATERGLPTDRCETLAELALAAARSGRATVDMDLLDLAERSAHEAAALARLLPGHPPWGARADAAIAAVELARGHEDLAAAAAGSAMGALQAAKQDDLDLPLILTAAGVLLATAPEEARAGVRELLRQIAAIVAQRMVDDDVRARFFRTGMGRELADLAGPLGPHAAPGSGDGTAATALDSDELRLLRLMSEGHTNAELARDLGVAQDEVVRRLGIVLRKLATTSRAEATAFAFRAGLM